MDYETATMNWNGMTIVMKGEDFPTHTKTVNKHKIREMVAWLEEPRVTWEVTESVIKILDNGYQKADLKEVAAKATQLMKYQQQQLLILRKYEYIFMEPWAMGYWASGHCTSRRFKAS